MRIPALIAVLWLASGVFLVRTDEQAVVTRIGRIVEPRVLPGIHWAMPWPMDRVHRLKVLQLQRMVVGGNLADAAVGRSNPLAAQFLTGDQNLIQLRAVVQYSIGIPADYLFAASEPDRVVAAAVESELARRIAHRDVDAVLTTEKAAIQEEVRGAAQQLMNGYRIGVLLASVSLETAAPPAEAAEAFRDVAGARADAARIVSEAEGYANDVVPRARGEAEQLLSAAQAHRQRRINEAQGDAARFVQVAAEYEKAQQVNGDRLYLETMEQILPRIKKLIVDANGNLDLTILRKGAP